MSRRWRKRVGNTECRRERDDYDEARRSYHADLPLANTSERLAATFIHAGIDVQAQGLFDRSPRPAGRRPQLPLQRTKCPIKHDEAWLEAVGPSGSIRQDPEQSDLNVCLSTAVARFADCVDRPFLPVIEGISTSLVDVPPAGHCVADVEDPRLRTHEVLIQ